MKKIYMTIGAFLLCASMAMAQTPANRTAKTVAADVLAQMPAQEQKAYNELIGQLSAADEGAVQTLIGMINAPGKGSNAQVDYALSGLSHYVMAKGKENERVVVSKAYCQALETVSERETQAFLIRQLEIMGGDEAVETLAGFLNDERLSGPAARALSRIDTKMAGTALVSSLKRRMGTPKTQRDAMNAIAEMQPGNVEGAETLLLTFASNTDMNLRKTALYALSCVGSEASLETLEKAAESVHYTMEPSGANEAYIRLLKRLVADGKREVVEKAAKNLQKKAHKADAQQTREAALEIWMSATEPKEATKLLLSALKDKDKGYRNAALDYASAFVDETADIEIAKFMMKAKPDVKVDILNWIGREAKCKQKNPIWKKLMIRFDLPFASVLRDELNTEDEAVRQAVVWAMVKIGDKGFIPTLANLLTSNEKQMVLLAQDALLAFPGDIDDEVAKAIGKAGDWGKIAGIELLAQRMADSKVNTILAQREHSSSEVRAAVYKALKDVVTARDFVEMCGILESSTDAEEIKETQAAVSASVLSMPEAEQVEAIVRRMYQAGEVKKHLYYPILAATGQQKALDLIIEGCQKNTGAAKEAAVEALLAWNDLRAADFLYEVAQSDGALAAKALTRYIELIAASDMTGENRLLRLRKAMDVAQTAENRNLVLQKVQETGTFLALLYAGEFLDDKAVQQSAAQAVMNIALAHPQYTGENVRALLEKVSQVLDNPDADYQREGIKKHLAEMPDEVGFVSIFNGKDLTGWKGLVENPIARAKMTPAQLAKKQAKADEQMRKDWKVEDGCLVFEGSGFDNLCTEKSYGDFEMYVEWMLDPAGPEADAGIYLRGTPQVQIWDTARVNVGAQVGSGGLYNNQQNPSKPTKVADNKLGEWNTFYIKMVGDRVTVDLNGERVVDNVILENYWDRKQPIFPVEQIELQAHGSRCSFRNLYVKELKRVEPFQLSEEEKREGFKVLFDGTNMYEWMGNTGDYVLADGCISMEPSRSFGGNLYTKGEYADFVYRFEFQLTPGANNGVGLRAPLEGDAAYVGMESQILDCEHPIYSNITPLQHHGSIYGILPANEQHVKAMKPVGEWNYEEIVCDGDYIKVTLNGVVIVEGNIREATKQGTPDGQEHPGLFNKKGHIGFLGHGSPVKFRNIRIKELKH